MRLIRGILQLVLVILVIYFGYFYLTREELHSCVSIPLAALDGKSEKIKLDQGKIEEFLTRMGRGLENVTSKSGELLEQMRAVETTQEAKMSDQLLDQGQYLYCKAVVEKVEK